MNIPEIKECQKNRHPLLFIDKILENEPGKFAKSLKCFSYNEWFFPAHFEDEPNVPGFILVEMMVQTFIMTFLAQEELKGKKTNFIKIQDVQFKKMIVPGDTVINTAELKRFKRGIAEGTVTSHCNNEIVCTGNFIVSIPDILNGFRPNKNQ